MEPKRTFSNEIQAFTLAFLPSFDFCDFERFLAFLMAFGDFDHFRMVFHAFWTILMIFPRFWWVCRDFSGSICKNGFLSMS